MHIRLVTETYPPEISGVALTVQSLARGLRDFGRQVSRIRPAQPAAKPDDEFDRHRVATEGPLGWAAVLGVGGEPRRAIGIGAARAMTGRRGGAAAAGFAARLARLIPPGPRQVRAQAA